MTKSLFPFSSDEDDIPLVKLEGRKPSRALLSSDEEEESEQEGEGGRFATFSGDAENSSANVSESAAGTALVCL